ncbi:restriction endonuclease [Vibrio mediterranei]|uniref:restriction endonuclease n=1 Tax=Vibrio mediterranei TaxID=689 RepID=UPI00148C90EB|nr:restriction endonuclease [Vibrio mediterranei]NOI26609.1 hypothetical protein [Vibrio mediterranei]
MSDVTWETYEEVAQYLIDKFAGEFGLESVEGKQTVAGDSGTNWELDAKGIRGDGESIVLVECKRYTTKRVSQEVIAGLAFRIIDTNATGGIIVSPLGLQKGAEIVAEHADVINVRLDKDSTTQEYVMEFLNSICVGLTDTISVSMSESVNITIQHADGMVEHRKL